MAYSSQLRRNIIWVALLVTLLLVFSLLVGLLQAWKTHIENEQILLVRNASTVSTYVQSTVIDASKLLDIAHIKLEDYLSKGKLTPNRARETLSEIANQFSLYNASDRFGLLLCTDAKGALYAQSGGLTPLPLNLADRYYFRSLKEYPTQRMSIGDLVTTRTTNKSAFHLSMPLHDKDGKFAGVIAQQILEEDLSNDLVAMMDHGQGSVYTFAKNHNVTFVFPYSETNNPRHLPDVNRLLALIDAQKQARGSFVIQGDKINLPGTIYVGYAWSPILGTYTVAIINETQLFKTFIKASQFTIGYGALALIIVAILFAHLYQQTKKLDASRFASSHDALTGLNNRRCLDENFDKLWRESMRNKQPISVLFMDIDHFKQFNDKYGHEAGDSVLKAVASAISRTLKRPLDFTCRWGGEEFVAVLADTAVPGAQIIAERIMEAVHSISLVEANQALDEVTISIGIASLTVNPENQYDDLIGMADQAMMAAKAAGRNCLFVYKPESNITNRKGKGCTTKV